MRSGVAIGGRDYTCVLVKISLLTIASGVHSSGGSVSRVQCLHSHGENTLIRASCSLWFTLDRGGFDQGASREETVPDLSYAPACFSHPR
jgi:hypothetical protein